jgi:hypothetical protein
VGQPPETSRYYARGRDHHLPFWYARVCPDSLDGLNNIHAFDDFAKHNVPLVEPRCDNGCDKELGTDASRSVFQAHVPKISKTYLRTIRVGTGVGHGE